MHIRYLFACFFCIIFSFTFAQSKHTPQHKNYRSGFPIIDMHFHSDWWGMPEVEEPLSGFKSQKDRKTYVAESFKYLDKYDIVRAVTDGKYTRDYQKIAPEKIIPAHGSLGAPVDSLRKWFKSGKYSVMAEFEPQYSGFSPSDKSLDPYYALAEELDVPLGIHVGLGPPGAPYIKGLEKYRMSLSNPLLLEDALVRHPKIRLYVMHGGWPFLDEMVGLLYAHPQVYIDIAVINWVLPRKEFHQYLRRIVEAGFGNRIMYGSDEMQWPQSIQVSVESILSASFLTKKQKEDILYKNAARFLRLSDEQIKKDKKL
ncbi:amidohydrolase [Pedobacter sp. ISL-68]|uniref:amidohydrolase family protein n=1 Tax=unclassified Pedobacter TaxID=2628915 RepID=UPI001BEA8B96|nr:MULTISPECIES: amidohydrolase family protein [unclassified Pedobacter]MBT2560214.1 amidohydrolase [Pedobacter sp. ISL-64]MBT2589194.1 amidohydrolase [Pedobacter sp. ISL-68]